MPIDAVRTPEARFENLPDFDYTPKYAEDLPGYEGLRMAYLDEGPSDAEHVFLCLHGQPSWSFLYRKMIPPFLASGGRVIAPDFFGFGRSDKPTDDDAYGFSFHRDALLALIETLSLTRFTLVCQDWGGLIGLTLPVAIPRAVERLIVMNTALAVGVDPGPGFKAWKEYVASQPDFDVGGLMARAIPGLTDEDKKAYEAPFPSVEFKAGVRTFPALVPVTPEMPGAALSKQAAAWWSSAWKGQAFMAVGVQDPVLGPPVMKSLRRVIQGCPEPLMLEEAGHFVQEAGAHVAEAALAAFAESPTR
ncbi:MAG: haloalkane dehalogenase [Sandaracinaceae bacterium]